MAVTVTEFIKEKGFDIKNVALYGVDANGNHNDFEKSYIDCDAVYDDLEVHDYIINDEDVIIFIKTDDIYAVVCITGNLNFQKVTRDNFFEKLKKIFKEKPEYLEGNLEDFIYNQLKSIKIIMIFFSGIRRIVLLI